MAKNVHVHFLPRCNKKIKSFVSNEFAANCTVNKPVDNRKCKEKPQQSVEDELSVMYIAQKEEFGSVKQNGNENDMSKSSEKIAVNTGFKALYDQISEENPTLNANKQFLVTVTNFWDNSQIYLCSLCNIEIPFSTNLHVFESTILDHLVSKPHKTNYIKTIEDELSVMGITQQDEEVLVGGTAKPNKEGKKKKINKELACGIDFNTLYDQISEEYPCLKGNRPFLETKDNGRKYFCVLCNTDGSVSTNLHKFKNDILTHLRGKRHWNRYILAVNVPTTSGICNKKAPQPIEDRPSLMDIMQKDEVVAGGTVKLDEDKKENNKKISKKLAGTIGMQNQNELKEDNFPGKIKMTRRKVSTPPVQMSTRKGSTPPVQMLRRKGNANEDLVLNIDPKIENFIEQFLKEHSYWKRKGCKLHCSLCNVNVQLTSLTVLKFELSSHEICNRHITLHYKHKKDNINKPEEKCNSIKQQPLDFKAIHYSLFLLDKDNPVTLMSKNYIVKTNDNKNYFCTICEEMIFEAWNANEFRYNLWMHINDERHRERLPNFFEVEKDFKKVIKKLSEKIPPNLNGDLKYLKIGPVFRFVECSLCYEAVSNNLHRLENHIANEYHKKRKLKGSNLVSVESKNKHTSDWFSRFISQMETKFETFKLKKDLKFLHIGHMPGYVVCSVCSAVVLPTFHYVRHHFELQYHVKNKTANMNHESRCKGDMIKQLQENVTSQIDFSRLFEETKNGMRCQECCCVIPPTPYALYCHVKKHHDADPELK